VKTKLTDQNVRNLNAKGSAYLVWDSFQHGLVVQVQPTGHKAWKAIYRSNGRPRWYTIGRVDAIGLGDARRLAARIMSKVAEGEDPAADKVSKRAAGSFGELAERYLNEYAKRKNKSWRQHEKLVQNHLLPQWAKLSASAITRADIKAMRARLDERPIANQVQAAASAIFSWAMAEGVGNIVANPCANVERTKLKPRERVLSESEIQIFWNGISETDPIRANALKMILLTGQRPGEVAAMRMEHVRDGWWELPGDPVGDWPGTKNGLAHRVWLPAAVRDFLPEVSEGFAFPGARGRIIDNLDMAMRKLPFDPPVTPHDLRRTHGTMITSLGFGREAMNRIQNHKEGGIADVYDRHDYSRKNMQIMEAVANHIIQCATDALDEGKVVSLR
jgi:integrase